MLQEHQCNSDAFKASHSTSATSMSPDWTGWWRIPITLSMRSRHRKVLECGHAAYVQAFRMQYDACNHVVTSVVGMFRSAL